jgi:hypothetical protein
MESKICSKCKKDKPIDGFSTDKGKLKSQCKICVSEYNKSYKAKNIERVRYKWRLASRKYHNYDNRRNKTLRKYGLTEIDYNRMYDEQEGKCAICESSLTLVVDHCHETLKVRNLLCNRCNRGIGTFKDNVELIKKALEYLLRHRSAR